MKSSFEASFSIQVEFVFLFRSNGNLAYSYRPGHSFRTRSLGYNKLFELFDGSD